ncbi:MAG: nucleotide sugar dehydrogenase [Deltaproteobacteria bacterium]|nr:nucleotide sugar dehydrogenase [Deltaproteobacteria bacterium]
MKVAVLGMGYVGCVTAGVLAREGHHVVGVDANASKVAMLAQGQSPVLEPGLPELIRRSHISGHLKATAEAADAIAAAEVIIVCVGTPSNGNGGLDSHALERVAAQIGCTIARHDGYPVVLVRSTVLPETLEEVIVPVLERGAGSRVGDGFGLAVNPEFLREGSAVHDFDSPQFTLVGTAEPRSAAIVRRLYGFLKAPVFVTDRQTAALVKYASNAFHAMKVAFANEIAAISGAVGADASEVMRLFCLDHKLNLSAAYLKPGMPFGGSCLPKDLRALLYSGRRRDVPLPLLSATLKSNRVQTAMCIERILAFGRPRVGIFGLAFKGGTDDLRESPTVAIVEALLGKGISLAIYDGRVSLAHLVGSNRDYVAQHLPHIESLLRPTLEEVVNSSDVLVIGNNDEEFHSLPQRMRSEQTLIDLVGVTAANGALATDRVSAAGR